MSWLLAAATTTTTTPARGGSASGLALADVVAVLSILTAAGIVITGALYWRAARSADVRRVTIELREIAQEAISLGGLDTPRFLEDGPRRTEQELEDLLGRLNDRRLRTAATALLEAYRSMFASAPPRRGARVYFSESPPNPAYAAEDRLRAEQHARQADHARETLEAAATALARVNRLEKFLWRRS